MSAEEREEALNRCGINSNGKDVRQMASQRLSTSSADGTGFKPTHTSITLNDSSVDPLIDGNTNEEVLQPLMSSTPINPTADPKRIQRPSILKSSSNHKRSCSTGIYI